MSQPAKETYTLENAKEHLKSLLGLMKIDKVIFIDDSLGKEPDVNNFIGLIRKIESINKLGGITDELLFIEYSGDLDFFVENIQRQWEQITPTEKIKCFEIAYKILEEKEEYTNINVSSVLQNFFDEDVLILYSPTEWETYFKSFQPGDKRIVALFDQDLKKEGGKYETIKGQDLILEVKKKGFRKHICPALFTFTIQDINEEIGTRTKIIQEFHEQKENISSEDFFVFTKDRLNKANLLVDAIKKLFLNEYCERIKNETTSIAKAAFDNTIKSLEALDTYSFDWAILKSSFKEGIWESETLLRIINIYYEDFIKEQMITSNYLLKTNDDLQNAHSISNIVDIPIENTINSPYKEPIQLREKELYESGEIINNLHKPVENGDVFELTFADDNTSLYIFIAQECDLMIRNQGLKKGNRNAKSGTFLKISEILPEKLKKFEWKNDNYKLEYLGDDFTKTANINFTESLQVDLSIVDLVMFNEKGKATLELTQENQRLNYFSSALKERYTILLTDFKNHLDSTFELISTLKIEPDSEAGANLINRLSKKLIIIGDMLVKQSIKNDSLTFEIKRVKHLRNPYSRFVLEKYMRFQARTAEQHDFAKKK